MDFNAACRNHVMNAFVMTNAIGINLDQMLTRNLLGEISRKNFGSHIDASHSRQPLVKGERLVRYEVNAVM